MNSNKIITETKRIILDSYYRYSGTNNNPRFIFPSSGVKGKVAYINSISIPHTFYNISFGSSLVWTDASSSVHAVNIPVGDYSINELLTEIQTQMNADTTDNNTYSVSLNQITNKVVISSTGGNFILNADTSPRPGDLRDILGFRTSEETDQDFLGDKPRFVSSLSGASTYTAIDTFFIGKRNLYIGSNLLSNVRGYNSVVLDTGNLGNGAGPILQRKDIFTYIPLNTYFGETINWNAGNEAVKLALSNNITDLEFAIYDEYFREVDLNGRSWTIELVFQG